MALEQTGTVLGVDIGNSKTSYALAGKDGTILQVRRGFGANYQEIGRDEMVRRLSEEITQIMAIQNQEPAALSFIYYGAAGADTPTDFEILRQAFADVVPAVACDFENDGWIALHSGTRASPGMVVTCGTSNTNFAVNHRGERMRIGGLEEALGDVLGAPIIARYAMMAAMRSEDGRDEPTILTGLLAQHFAVSSIAELINLERTPRVVEEVIKLLFSAAQHGDGKSLELCWTLVKEVLKIVERFYRGLFQNEERFTLVLEGSFFKQRYQPFMTMLDLALHQRYPVDVVVPEHDPVVGAVFLALQGSGVTLTAERTDRVITTYLAAEKRV